MSAYLRFEDVTPPERKTRLVHVHSKSSPNPCLGVITFYGGWRQYVWQPGEDTEFSAGCLREIADFVDGLNTAWRDSHKQRRVAQEALL